MTKTLRFSVLLLAGFVLSSCGWLTSVSITGVELSEGTITPAFDVAVTEYTATVPNATESVDVTVTSESADLAVTINDTSVLPGTGIASVPLAVGENTITIVLSEEGESTTYTVVVTRLEPPEISVIGYAYFYDEMETVLESGSTVDFADIYGAGASRTMSFTIQNTGTGPLTLTGTPPNYVTIANDDDPGAYSVSVQPTSDTIAPGEQESFSIEFIAVSPSDTKTATVTIPNDDGDEGTFTLSLTGFWC